MSLIPSRMRSSPPLVLRDNRLEVNPASGLYWDSATCVCLASCVTFGASYSENVPCNYMYNFSSSPAEVTEAHEKAIKKLLKSEAKAQDLLRDIIGFEQWKVYRKTNRVVVMGKFDWLIGNVFGSYNPKNPIASKPDVVRIDGKSKIKRKYYGTSFCVVDKSQERMPYTDKVLAFAINCCQDEKGFYKMANSVGERTFNVIPECAIFKMEPT